MFEESCKQARRYYLLVATVSIAVALFVFTAKAPKDLYDRAHIQTSTSLAIDWRAYNEFVKERLDAYGMRRYQDNLPAFFGYTALDLNREVRIEHSGYSEYADRKTLSLDELFTYLMRSSAYAGYGGNLQGLNHAEIAYSVDRGHALRAFTFEGYQRAKGDDRESYEQTPLDIVRLVTSPVGRRDAAIIVADPVAVASVVREFAQITSTATARGVPTRARVSGFTVEGRASLSSSDLIDLNAPSVRFPDVEIDIRSEIKVLNESDQQAVKWLANSTVALIKADVIEVPGTSLAAWLGQRWPALGTVRDGIMHPFTGLEHVWPTIADRSLLDAELYLAAGLSAEQASPPSVSLGGVELPASLVPLAGPIVLAALIFQLARFLGYAVSRAEHHKKSLKELPWLLIHSRFGHLETACVVMLLPIAVQALVTWRLPMTDPPVLITGWIATGIAVAAGFRVFSLIKDLRLLKS